MKEISLEPSVKLPFAFSSHGKEKSYSDNFAWIEFGLAVFWDIFHFVVYLAEELNKLIASLPYGFDDATIIIRA